MTNSWLVDTQGLEPRTNCVWDSRSANWTKCPFVVGGDGVEPPEPSSTDFKSVVYTFPPHAHTIPYKATLESTFYRERKFACVSTHSYVFLVSFKK